MYVNLSTVRMKIKRKELEKKRTAFKRFIGKDSTIFRFECLKSTLHTAFPQSYLAEKKWSYVIVTFESIIRCVCMCLHMLRRQHASLSLSLYVCVFDGCCCIHNADIYKHWKTYKCIPHERSKIFEHYFIHFHKWNEKSVKQFYIVHTHTHPVHMNT